MANFSTGLQMGMGLARDVRSANMAAAERRERSKYREEDLALRKKSQKQSRKESKTRIKSLKEGMKRDRRRESRDMSVDSAKLLNENLNRQINEQKLKNSRNPSITAFNNYKGLLEEYQKNSRAADQRFAGELAPVNKALAEAKMSFTASESVPNLVATRDKMVADHKDFKHGLEQSFMAASNRPYEGKWSIRPYFNEFTNTMSYGAMLEGASGPEVEAAMKSITSMGGNVGMSAGASAANPAPSVDPNDPFDIRKRTNQRINRDAP
jgi:hypothetical protein